MNIAVASGKGGTGKTTVAVNLAASYAMQGLPVTLVDCDVEEPNAHLFVDARWQVRSLCGVPVPAIDPDRCLGESCRRCVEACRFKALAMLGGELLVFAELCHGCGLCELVCPAGVVGTASRPVGEVRQGVASCHVHGETCHMAFRDGVLRVGEAMATPLIKAVKRTAEDANATSHAGYGVTLWDCPPGTACATINALDEADFVVLVAESTAFGLHDLRLAVGLVRHLGLPHGIVINRFGMGDDRVATWAASEGIDVLGRLPFSLEAASRNAGGGLLLDASHDLEAAYRDLGARLLEKGIRS